MTKRILTYILAIFCLLLVSSPAPRSEAASSSSLTEEQVKAAYIYNFAKFVQWPETAFLSANEPLRICFVGSEDLFKAMESLSDKTIQGRPLKISKRSTLKTTPDCHILFISRHYQGEAWQELKKNIFTPVLTIADFDSFVSGGGIIELVREGSKIRFAVNIAAARQAGLNLSSKLLKLAIFVEE
ncbi:MAG: YfiR family protein [Deltaproteobacteria bacterium]|nr:YfiR family protein [Deltaproteobacteria bacterium]